MRVSLRAGAAATAVLFSAACVDRYTIAPMQLQYLNRYDIHGEQSVNGVLFTDQPYRLLTTQGEPVDYNSSKELLLLGAGGAPLAPTGPFQSILINGDKFDAIPVTGHAFEVPLQSVSSVEVVEYSASKTALIITLFTLLATLVPYAIVEASHSGSSTSASVGRPTGALK